MDPTTEAARLEAHWRAQDDAALLAAAATIADYSEDGANAIRRELARRGLAIPEPPMPPYYCPSCGMFGSATTITPGHFLMEVVLWLAFIIPGILYSLWRLSARRRGCRTCGAHVVPSGTPVGLAAWRGYREQAANSGPR